MTRQVRHPIFARLYARISANAEAKGGAEHRQEMLAGLKGRVVEVGAGNGLNFGHYPATVTEVMAVEPEPHLRKLAQVAAEQADVAISVVDGPADSLPLRDGTCDAAVCSLVLCSVDDQAEALAEVRRVLRPGGELRFYEHVRSGHRWFGRAEDLIDPIWSRVAGGCHPNRDTLVTIRTAGFEVSEVEQISFGLQHVLGRATKV